MTRPSDPLGLRPGLRVRVLLGLLVAVGALLEPPRSVQVAYIDPGFGAMMLQLLTAAVLGTVFRVKGFRRHLTRLVARLRGRPLD